ncbi:MAG: hypothetical protein A3J28_04455 [Acidobacteria bacterium RIFCSPLOWO2_12_FULL_60_22]|nr:MAG: hypothetical protein A3J28_04455 [Acidobacteria bacterium RIFCSPLOWO2_12_FULL_60_22]
MIKAIMRAVFYLSIFVLVGLVVWAYSTAKTWQEVALAATQTQARAAKVAKDALDRADRCVSEAYKPEPPAKTPGKTAGKTPAKTPAKATTR